MVVVQENKLLGCEIADGDDDAVKFFDFVEDLLRKYRQMMNTGVDILFVYSKKTNDENEKEMTKG